MTFPTQRRIIATILLLAGTSVLFGASKPRPVNTPNGATFFENRIRPILIQRCYECHSEQAKKQKGGLWLDRSSGWLTGGESGPAVVPHDISKSLLAAAVQYEDEDLAMPPEDPLSEEEVALLLRWIKMGAPGPRKEHGGAFVRLGDQVALGEKAKTHWSFQPITRPPVPAVDEAPHPVDAFIHVELKEQGLQSAPIADRRTQLRRLAYDLTGLPPSYALVETFAHDPDPKAYLRAVDELLASPQFGERWGRFWLDIARYADTREWQAAGADSRYPHAYTYRDYVIRSLNDDKPYDQFIREQVAADYYADAGAPELAALGFLTVGPRYRNNRDEIYNDRIDVVTRGVMGLTVSCARCHDHKYDPIPTADYYALHGVFASTKDPVAYPVIRGYKRDPEQAKSYVRANAKAEQTLLEYKQELSVVAMADFKKKPAAYLGAMHGLIISKKDNVRKLIAGNTFKETTLTPFGRSLPRLVAAKVNRKHPIWRPWSMLMGTSEPGFAQACKDFLAGEKAGTNPMVLAGLMRDPVPADRKAFMLRYGEIIAEALRAKDNADAAAIVASVDDPAGPFYISPDAAAGASRLLGIGRKKLADLDAAILEVDIEHPGSPARAMTLVDLPKAVNSPIYERGEATRKGAVIPRRFLTALGGKTFGEGSGRKELAEAMTDPSNPFTPRVHVNRVWMHLFGQPLVETPGDFGLQAEPPTHPELLDWLAADFIEQGWSTKKLIRRIVLSQTYRQSSRGTASAGALDPENRYLSHAHVRRLDFESMRDAMLAASGDLDLTSGGRAVDITVAPYPPRRTVYAFVDRVNLDDMFSTFDFPSPDTSSPVRPQTMVPQQALFSMNDPFTISQARKLSVSPEMKSMATSKERVIWLYQRVFQRDPSPDEISAAQGFLRSGVASRNAPSTAEWQYGWGSADPAVSAAERFKAFPFWDTRRQAYQFSKLFPHPKHGYTRLTATGGHPGASDATILRWTAPEDGPFSVTGMLRHATEKGDGVHAQIIHSRLGVVGDFIGYNTNQMTRVIKVQVEAGDMIDFVTDCREATLSDSYRWTPTIKKLGMAETMEPGVKAVWQAEMDFDGPPPTPLTPLAQLAHALLMTNEFLFID